ncbi:MAG: hypothetical protein MZV49_05440 [Rhodopseudomonas palustris]|nr:hypothetical protein [Rhodopseudomonas palustris]
MAAYFAVAKPGDTILGHEPDLRRPPDPRLARSTSRANFTTIVPYGLNEGHRTDRLRRRSRPGTRADKPQALSSLRASAPIRASLDFAAFADDRQGSWRHPHG